MPFLFINNYDTELLEMNPEAHHLYIESHVQFGGERKCVSCETVTEACPSPCVRITAI